MTVVWGITGRMGAGKTTVSERLWMAMRDRGLPCRTLLVDNLRHRAITYPDHPRHLLMCRELSRRFGIPADSDGQLHYPSLCRAALSSRAAQDAFSAIASPVLIEDAREEIADMEGLVLLEWARLLEDGFGQLVDGPVILVTCPEHGRTQRFSRGLSGDEVAARIALQPSDGEYADTARTMGFKVVHVDNSGDRKALDRRLRELVSRYCTNVPVPDGVMP